MPSPPEETERAHLGSSTGGQVGFIGGLAIFYAFTLPGMLIAFWGN